jgi:hypothetical protein
MRVDAWLKDGVKPPNGGLRCQLGGVGGWKLLISLGKPG